MRTRSLLAAHQHSHPAACNIVDLERNVCGFGERIADRQPALCGVRQLRAPCYGFKGSAWHL